MARIPRRRRLRLVSNNQTSTLATIGFTEAQLAKLVDWRIHESWKFSLVLRSVDGYLRTHDYYTLALVDWDQVFAEIDKVPDPDKEDDVPEADVIVVGARIMNRGLTAEEFSRLHELEPERAELYRAVQSIPSDDFERFFDHMVDLARRGERRISLEPVLKHLKIKLGEVRYGDDVPEMGFFMECFRPTPISSASSIK